MYTGSCLCKQVQFEFEPTPTDISICHCSICRHTTGTAFSVAVKVASRDLKLTGGEDQLSAYNATDNLKFRFCKNCGSPVYSTHDAYPAFSYVAIGAMAEGSDIHPGYHEFVGSKAGWYEIQDDLPQHEGWSDSE